MITTMPSFLFVCTGNICRSPLAELAMRYEAKKRGLELNIDSAGIDNWHIGDKPDPRACATARRHKLDATHLRARQVKREDFERFSHILALDRSHLNALKRLQPAKTNAKISLLLDNVTGREGQDVIDPYYGPDEGFEITWHDVKAGCQGLAYRLLDMPPYL